MDQNPVPEQSISNPNNDDEHSESDEDASNVRPKRKHNNTDNSNANVNPSPRKNKKNKWKHGRDERIFEYGNYEKYYGTRKPENDNRIYVLKKEWFTNKDCLDIGCNSGKFTINMAYKFDPESILGIDIDDNLINSAKQYLSTRQPKKSPYANFPLSFQLTLGQLKAPKFPQNVSFTAGNILEMKFNQKFDTITCFSVTKWIHLNWGDEGIKKMFQIVAENLKPGGLFIVEPQLWNSYKKKRNLTPKIHQVYLSIKFRPDEFTKYLTEELKFKLISELQVEASAAGFSRKIFVFQNDSTPQDVSNTQNNNNQISSSSHSNPSNQSISVDMMSQ